MLPELNTRFLKARIPFSEVVSKLGCDEGLRSFGGDPVPFFGLRSNPREPLLDPSVALDRGKTHDVGQAGGLGFKENLRSRAATNFLRRPAEQAFTLPPGARGRAHAEDKRVRGNPVHKGRTPRNESSVSECLRQPRVLLGSHEDRCRR